MSVPAIEKIHQTVHAPLLRELAAYWYAQRGANVVTRRSDFDVFRFASLLPHMFLYDYDSRTRDLTLRLAGEEIRRMLPNSVAGTPLDRIMPAQALPEVQARYRRVCEQPAVSLVVGRVFLSLGGSGIGERLLLPLADSSGKVFQMLGATIYQVGDALDAGSTFAREEVQTTFFPLQGPSETE